MADSTYLSIEAVADETNLTSGNSQMTPIVTGGTIRADTATFTDWPLEGKTRSARYDASTISGGCYSSVTPSGATGGWDALYRLRMGAFPAATMSFLQRRHSAGVDVELKMTPTGVIQVFNAANTLIHSFPALPAGALAWYMGIYSKPDPTVGEITINIWLVDGTLHATFSTTTTNTGSTQTSERVGSKINSGTAVWSLWVGQIDHNHTSETAQVLAPPVTNPVPASSVVNGWIHDESTDEAPGTLSISNVVLDPAVLFLVDDTNRRIAVELSDDPIDYSYRITNTTTSRFATETGTIPASTGGEPSPAQRMRMVGGVLTELL